MLHLKPKFAVQGSEVELGGSFVDPVQPLQEFDEKCQFFLCFYFSYAIFLFLNFTSGLCAIVQRMQRTHISTRPSLIVS